MLKCILSAVAAVIVASWAVYQAQGRAEAALADRETP